MLARLTRELPAERVVYEPKWDGFRCLAFREAEEVYLQSRNGRPLARYFPEVVDAIRRLQAQRVVLDGELVARGDEGFEALLARIHPAASRVERLRVESPATYVAFDVLELGADDLRRAPFEERRRALEDLLREPVAGVELTPATADPTVAGGWLAGGVDRVDGVVAKPLDEPYRPGVRALVKVKPRHTADCVVGGFRVGLADGLPTSLLLGLYEPDGSLAHVGVAASFRAADRRRLVDELRPHVVSLGGHPWQHGFLLEGGSTGRLPGAAGRWAPGMELDWVPLAPTLVCEVAYDRLDGRRFRHVARFVRWRPDRDPRSCTVDQLLERR